MTIPDSTSTTELEGRYAPPAKPLASLVGEADKVVRAFLGPDWWGNGSATWDGPPRVNRSFKSLQEWATAMGRAPAYASYTMYPTQSGRRINVSVTALRFELSVTALDADVDAARDALIQLAAAFELQPEEVAREGDRASAEQEYFFPKPEDPASLRRVLTAAAGIAPPKAETQIRVRTQDGATVTVRRLDDPRLDDLFGARWGDVSGIDSATNASRLRVSVDFRLTESAVAVRIEAPDVAQAKMHLETIERAATFERVASNVSLKGRKKLYAPKGALDAAWFSRAVAALAKTVPPVGYNSCSYRLIDSRTEEVVNRDYKQWAADVVRQWDRVDFAYCWLDGRIARAVMRVDPRREHVDLTVEARTDARADEIMSELVRQLDLKAVPDNVPSRRTGAVYRITRWGNKPFAESLDSAIKRVFGGRTPAIEDAWVDEVVDGEFDRVLYRDLDSLLERLNDVKPIGGMGVRAHAREASIGVYEYMPKGFHNGARTLEIRSSLGPAEFPDVVAIFRQGIGLPKKPLSDGDVEGGGGEQKEKSKSFDWRAPLFSIVATGVVSVGLTSTVLLSVVPRSSLEITVPTHEGETPIAMPAAVDSVHLEWIVKRTHFGRTTISRAVPAMVRVISMSGVTTPTKIGQPKLTVLVAPGLQTIEVMTLDSSESAVIRVLIPPKP